MIIAAPLSQPHCRATTGGESDAQKLSKRLHRVLRVSPFRSWRKPKSKKRATASTVNNKVAETRTILDRPRGEVAT